MPIMQDRQSALRLLPRDMRIAAMCPLGESGRVQARWVAYLRLVTLESERTARMEQYIRFVKCLDRRRWPKTEAVA